MSTNTTNYTRTFENTNDELTADDFRNMKNQLVPCSPELEKAMITDPDFIDWLKVSRNLELPENVILQNIARLDRPFIVKVQKIPDVILEEQLAKFDWEDVQKYQQIPLRIMKEHYSIINFKTVLTNVKYPMATLEYLSNVDSDLVDLIIETQTVDEKFLEARINSTNVNIISKYQKLSSEFIERHFQMFKPDLLATHQQMSEELIEKHIKVFDITMLAKYQNLSIDFCKRYNINPSMIIMYQTPSLEYIEQSLKFNENSKTMIINRITAPVRFNLRPIVNPAIETYVIGLYSVEEISNRQLDSAFIVRNAKVLDMMVVLKNNKLSMVDLRTLYPNLDSICKCLVYLNQDNADWKKKNISGFKFWNDPTSFETYKSLTPKQKESFTGAFSAYVQRNMKWSGLFRENQIPEWFFDEFANHVDWTYVIRTQKLSSGCLQRNLIRLDSNYLVQYVKLEEEFILFNREVLVWELVCQHQNITPNIVRECHEFIDVVALKKNQNLSTTALNELLSAYNVLGVVKEQQTPTPTGATSSGLFGLVKSMVK